MGLALGVTYRRDMERINAATDEMTDYCRRLVAKRRQSLSEDFLSTLIRQQDIDPSFSDEEMLNLMVGLVFGGIDTTRNQLGLGMDLFMAIPPNGTCSPPTPHSRAMRSRRSCASDRRPPG